MLIISINKRTATSVSEAQDESDHYKEDDQAPEFCQIKNRIESIDKAHVFILRCQAFLLGAHSRCNRASHYQHDIYKQPQIRLLQSAAEAEHPADVCPRG